MSNELKVTGGEWRTESFLGDWVIYNDADELVETVYSGEANARLLAASKKLYEALKPFADCAELFDEGVRGSNMPSSGIFQAWGRIGKDYELTVDDLRNARAALAAARGEAQ